MRKAKPRSATETFVPHDLPMPRYAYQVPVYGSDILRYEEKKVGDPEAERQLEDCLQNLSIVL